MANNSRRLAAGAAPLLRIFSLKRQPHLPSDVDFLWRRLSALTRTDGEVTSAINEYIEEGKAIRKVELERFIRQFRRFNRHRHAFEIGEWMQSQNYILKKKDYAIHLQEIAKVKGIAAAENYFNAIPPSRKVNSTYGALLSCYCKEKMSDKAYDIFNKMVQDDMISSCLPFNHLMVMHIHLGQPEKAIRMVEVMKEANVQPNTSTYNLWMNAYSLLNDIEGVERVFREITVENEKLCDWTTYSNLANIYINAKDEEKARLALQNLEKVMSFRDREAYHFLISLYSRMRDLENTGRVWKSLKQLKGIQNNSYLIMIQALDNLDDINGLKECFEEWELICSTYDARLANAAIVAYLRHDMLEEAESVLERALIRSEGRLFYALEMLMIFHLKKHRVKQALQVMETAVSKASNGNWKPRRETVDRFLDFFEQESDVSSAEEFYELMKRMNCVDGHMYESLLRIYNVAGRKMRDVRARIESDGVEMSSELESLVGSISLD